MTKVTLAYANTNGDENKCIVNLYKFYMNCRPKNAKCDLRPFKKSRDDGTWYYDSPVGIHTLQSTISNMCQKAGFKGFYTNHSLRATCATRLYEAGLDEQLIGEKTGHSYKRTSDELLENVSNIVQG